MAMDFTQVGRDMAQLQALQGQLNTMSPADPARGFLTAQISGLQAAIQQEFAHAQAQADATANMFNQFEFTSMLGTAFSGLGQALPSAIALIGKL